MRSFYECLNKPSRERWDALMRAFNVELRTPQQKPISLDVVFENEDEIAEIMSAIPGFDRSDD